MISQIVERCKKLKIHEERTVSDTAAEYVFTNDEMPGLEAILAEYLGAPAKPKDARPSREDQEATKKFGGVFEGQTLYRKTAGGSTYIAMLWPWQDHVHTTVKIARL